MIFFPSFRRQIWLALAMAGLAAPTLAQPVSVQNVRFDRIRAPGHAGEWLEIAVELRGGPSIHGPESHAPRFNSHIEVVFQAAYAVEPSPEAKHYRFYRSRAEIAALLQNRRAFVYFYLPPEIVERDRLQREPFAWRVALSVEGQSLQHAQEQYSRSLADPAAAQAFLRRIAEDAPINDGLLQPIYLTPFFERDAGRLRDLPSFIRRETAPPASQETAS